MPLEIERKFLLRGDFRAAATSSTRIVQAYLCADGRRTVRLRLRGDEAFLTIKGRSTADGLSRYEFETPIPPVEALAMLPLCHPGRIDKERWLVPVGAHTFEVDVFGGENEGLILAEVELSHPEESFERPEWLGEEVTGLSRYYNAALTSHPYSQWSEEERQERLPQP